MNLQKCKMTSLATERLALRPVQPADANDIIRLANDFEVARRLARLSHPYGREDVQFFMDSILPEEAVWAVLRGSDGVFMGVTGLAPQERTAVLGYWLGRDYWGHGYMTEAATAIVQFALSDLALAGVRSGHFADNVASGSVLAKLGFVPVSKSRKYCRALDSEVAHVDMWLDGKDFLCMQTGEGERTKCKNVNS